MKNLKKMTSAVILFMLLVLLFTTNVFASIDINAVNKLDKNELINIIQDNIPEDTENVTAEDVINIYNKVTEKYSNEDIAELIEENKEEIKEGLGVTEEVINTGTQLLKTTDEEQLKEIINEDINIEEIQSKIEEGIPVEEIITEVFTPEKTAQIGTKLLLANEIAKKVITIVCIYILFNILVRWIIYVKADKPGWSILIPIYKDVTYLQVCKMNPLLIIIPFIPIIGWLIWGFIKIISRFKLAKAFGKGFLFGLGLLFLSPLFELILALSKNTYISEENVEEAEEVISESNEGIEKENDENNIKKDEE